MFHRELVEAEEDVPLPDPALIRRRVTIRQEDNSVPASLVFRRHRCPDEEKNKKRNKEKKKSHKHKKHQRSSDEEEEEEDEEDSSED